MASSSQYRPVMTPTALTNAFASGWLSHAVDVVKHDYVSLKFTLAAGDTDAREITLKPVFGDQDSEAADFLPDQKVDGSGNAADEVVIKAAVVPGTAFIVRLDTFAAAFLRIAARISSGPTINSPTLAMDAIFEYKTGVKTVGDQGQ